MSKLFSAFNAATKKEWIEKITTDLKGADYNETLIFNSKDGVSFPLSIILKAMSECKVKLDLNK